MPFSTDPTLIRLRGSRYVTHLQSQVVLGQLPSLAFNFVTLVRLTTLKSRLLSAVVIVRCSVIIWLVLRCKAPELGVASCVRSIFFLESLSQMLASWWQVTLAVSAGGRDASLFFFREANPAIAAKWSITQAPWTAVFWPEAVRCGVTLALALGLVAHSNPSALTPAFVAGLLLRAAAAEAWCALLVVSCADPSFSSFHDADGVHDGIFDWCPSFARPTRRRLLAATSAVLRAVPVGATEAPLLEHGTGAPHEATRFGRVASTQKCVCDLTSLLRACAIAVSAIYFAVVLVRLAHDNGMPLSGAPISPPPKAARNTRLTLLSPPSACAPSVRRHQRRAGRRAVRGPRRARHGRRRGGGRGAPIALPVLSPPLLNTRAPALGHEWGKNTT